MNNQKNWGRISIRCWIHKTQPIPRPNGRAMGCILWILVRKLTKLYRHRTVFTKRPIACPLERVMRCLLWVQTLIDILPQFLQWRIQHLFISHRVITAAHCSNNILWNRICKHWVKCRNLNFIVVLVWKTSYDKHLILLHRSNMD